MGGAAALLQIHVARNGKPRIVSMLLSFARISASPSGRLRLLSVTPSACKSYEHVD